MKSGIKWSIVNKQTKKNLEIILEQPHIKQTFPKAECEKLKGFFGLNILAKLTITTGEVIHHNFISNFHW